MIRSLFFVICPSFRGLLRHPVYAVSEPIRPCFHVGKWPPSLPLPLLRVPMMSAKNASESVRVPNICVCALRKRMNRCHDTATEYTTTNWAQAQPSGLGLYSVESYNMLPAWYDYSDRFATVQADIETTYQYQSKNIVAHLRVIPVQQNGHENVI